MIIKRLLFILATTVGCIVPVCAQDSEPAPDQPAKEKTPKEHPDRKVFTGFSGGMMLHIGYAFSSSPDELFRNASLKDLPNVANLPTDGVVVGLGGALRFHLLDHLHVGAEGYMSAMPLMKSGSSIRMGWGGGLIDGYLTWGKVKPFLGTGIGGGSSKRLYVPADEQQVVTSDSLTMNASYTKVPFFYLDPYIGLEIELTRHTSLCIKIDYLLPFGKKDSSLSGVVKWDNFIKPSGPRLYAGVMFGH